MTLRNQPRLYGAVFATSLLAMLGACDSAPSDPEARRLDLAAEIAEDADIDFDMALEIVDGADDAASNDGAPLAPTANLSAAKSTQASGCTVLSATVTGKVAIAYATGNFNVCRTMCNNWRIQLHGTWNHLYAGSPVHTCVVTSHLGLYY